MSLGHYLEKQIKLIGLDVVNNTAPLTQQSQNNSTRTGPCRVLSIAPDASLTVRLEATKTTISGVQSSKVLAGPGSLGILLYGAKMI